MIFNLVQIRKINISKISLYLLYLIVFLFPLNLGYHFTTSEAYVRGLLLDYLVPTIYIQDILVAFLLFLNIKRIKIGIYSYDKYLVWFLFTIFLSTLISQYFFSSIAAFSRLALYVLLTFYLRTNFNFKKEFVNITKVLGVSVILLSILSFFQWFEQGSVFDNYLFFGEQPYSISTPGINIENFFGVSKVPPYALFRHPNILGGLLSILLIWFLGNIERSNLLKVAFVFGLVVLFLTIAKFAWISFFLGLIIFIFYKSKTLKWKKYAYATMFFFIIIGFLLPFVPFVPGLSDHPSFYRRADLLESSYLLIKERLLFGVGYNSSTAFIDEHLPPKNDIRFAQPPHNIFVLVFVESGVFAFLAFLLFLKTKLKMVKVEPLIYIAILQIIFLGTFDHYFFTIHQPQLIMWLILGLI